MLYMLEFGNVLGVFPKCPCGGALNPPKNYSFCLKACCTVDDLGLETCYSRSSSQDANVLYSRSSSQDANVLYRKFVYNYK